MRLELLSTRLWSRSRSGGADKMNGLGFTFDSRFCSGCKACQMACKDKHRLPVGVNWRRVYEISGGEWRREGSAWVPDVYAYHLSVACNHCALPVCLEVCPASAIWQREDGIVLIDPDRCLGCGYCAWACPYGAPQIDLHQGIMTKCTLCYDEIDQGRPPACVAACPLRSLDYGRMEELENRSCFTQAQVFPFPNPGLTEPVLFVQPHPTHARRSALLVDPSTGAGEDVRLVETHSESITRLAPLVGFTLLLQAAIGMVLFTALMSGLGMIFLRNTAWVGFGRAGFTPAVYLAWGALGVSFLHLGKPWRAFGALRNWRSSWLSRELLCAGGFALSVLGAAQAVTRESGFLSAAVFPALMVTSGLLGLATLYSMVRVYAQRTVPGWRHTLPWLAFGPSPVLLGVPLAAAFMLLQSPGLIMAADPAGQLFRFGLEGAALTLLAASAIVAATFGAQRGDTPSLRLDLFVGLFSIGAGFCINHLAKAANPPASGSLAAFSVLFGLAFLCLAEIGRRFDFYRARKGL